MIRLSPGVLASAHKMLGIILEHQPTFENLSISYPSIDGTKTNDIFDTSIKCGWINIVDGVLCVKKQALPYIKSFDNNTKLLMLRDYIISNNPPWSSLIPKGRNECIYFMPVDVKSCFYDAGLMASPPAIDVVNWWDEIASTLRSEKQRTLLDVGRAGERLSLNYEFERTASKPKWLSIESNLIGYDILSQVSLENKKALCIEVKASKGTIHSAQAHITKREWETACNSDNYIFHLWILSNKPQLAIITPQEFICHMAVDTGEGSWESVEVPFNIFNDKFDTFASANC